MQFPRVAFAVALVVMAALAVLGGTAGSSGQAESNPPGWPSCCGIDH